MDTENKLNIILKRRAKVNKKVNIIRGVFTLLLVIAYIILKLKIPNHLIIIPSHDFTLFMLLGINIVFSIGYNIFYNFDLESKVLLEELSEDAIKNLNK